MRVGKSLTEAINGNSALAVVLNNLVLGLLSTAADDGGVTCAQDGDGVLADITEPDIGQCAST